HITCRGNRRQTVFLDEQDRRRYLWLLDEACGLYGWNVAGYCLMRNHVHLVARVGAGTISGGMQWLSGRYGQLFNQRHGETGHLFQGRFRAEIVEDEAYALEVVRYVDLNPVRAGVARQPADWMWSGYRALLGLEAPLRFHDVESTLRLVSANRDAARAHYAKYVAERLRQPNLPRSDRSSRPNRGQTPG
ncbi:MAG: transposase, partial [Gaiellaceae bacterium]